MGLLLRISCSLFASALIAAHAIAGPLPLVSPNATAHAFASGTGPVAATEIRLAGNDGSGRHFLRGPFTSVDGHTRPGLARFLADGSLDQGWMPALPAGSITQVVREDFQARVVVLSLDGATGEIRRLHPATGALVQKLDLVGTPQAFAMDAAANVYVASAVGNQAIFGATDVIVQRFDAASTAANPGFDARLGGQMDCPVFLPVSRVHALLHDGASSLYVAGDFTSIRNGAVTTQIAGVARLSAATSAVDAAWTPMQAAAFPSPAPSDGAKLTCFPTPQATVYSMALEPGGQIILGGFFDRQGVKYLGRFSTTAPGTVDRGWLPAPDNFVRSVSLDLHRHKLYATGAFGTISGATRRQLAAISSLPGAPVVTDWDPARISAASFSDFQADLGIAHADQVFVGGLFSHVSDGVARANAAAFPAAGTSILDDYYRSILGREPEASGIEYWYGEVRRLATQGVAPNEGFIAMATYFFGSPEFSGTTRTHAQFVERLYLAFFKRAPDAGGLAYWSGLASSGLPRDMVMFAFMFSAEFDAYMGGNLGATAPMRPEVGAVVDFYRGAFGRLPDNGGLQYWVNRFRVAQCLLPSLVGSAVTGTAADIATGFFTSTEYANGAPTNRDYVSDLYNAFLRRSADLDGFNYWVARLDGGLESREQVRASFMASPEFNARLQAIATAGCPPA